MKRYDVAVLGMGAVGSAAALHLVRRGAQVIGFDRFAPPHVWGSSHGQTRVTRRAIGEGEHLTPIAIRSHELWREIERESGEEILSETGLLIISSDSNAAQTHVSGFFGKTISAAEKFGISHQLIDATQIRSRWPQFRVRYDEAGYYEPAAGFTRPEAGVRAQLALAQRHGAEFRPNEPLVSFELAGNDVSVRTPKGSYSAEKLIVAAGAWLPQVIPEYARLFSVYRQVQLWFAVQDASRFAAERFPVFIWELQNSICGLYGFPAIDGESAIKVASEEFVATTTPDEVNRAVAPGEIAAVYALLKDNLPELGPLCTRASTCLYTVTPDFGFVIDTHPQSERVMIASPCSGHGFKHSPAIGEAVADLVLGQQPRFDLSPFRVARLSS